MASVYRFSRKSKKEESTGKPSKKNNREFSSIVFTDEYEAIPEKNESIPSPLAETENVSAEPSEPDFSQETETELMQTRSFDAAFEEDLSLKQKKEEKASKNDDTQAFDFEAFEALSAEDVDTPLSQELLLALQSAEVDSQKIDAVFNHTKGLVSSQTSQQEYDETTALLMEVFGTESDKKKKKKEAEPEPDPSLVQEAESVLSEEESLSQALEDSVGNTEDYVAIHDTPVESTKEYHATFSIEEALKSISPMEESETIPELADEVRVPDLDDPYSDTYEELEEKHAKRAVLPEEFTEQQEYDEFAEHLRNQNFKTLCTAIWSFFAFLVLFYLESATFSRIFHPEFLKPDSVYGAIFLLVDIQLLLIASLISLSTLAKGAKGLFSGKPNRHTISLLTVLFSVVYAVILLVCGAKEYPLFGCVAAFFLFMDAIAGFLDAKRIHRTFRICGRQGEKLVASELGGESPEAEAFRDQLSGEPKFYSVHKADFIDGFFRNSRLPAKAERSFALTLLLSLLFSVGFAVFSYLKEPELVLTSSRFMTMAVMTMPLSAIFTISFPFSHLSRKAEKRDSAIISVAAAEQYSAADVVSFNDKEIFPPKSVKVTTIRTYGQTRIDKAILYAAMIFQKLGGPLSLVFKKTVSGVYSEISQDFDFLEITADGMCAKIDGKEIFVGNKNYLLSYDFGYTKDQMDDGFEARSGKIMYMVIGSELAAKFYVRYSISKRFKKTILALFKCGICPAVKTCDPNIDSDLFRTLLQNDRIPAGIIKTCEAMKDAPVKERSESGIVCTSTIANLLHTFSLCDSLRHLTRTGVVVKILSLLLGAGIVFFLYFIENLTKVSGLFVLIYQILWMIPVILPSLSE